MPPTAEPKIGPPIAPQRAPLARDRKPAAGGLSIVVPLYNEAASIERLHGRFVEIAERLAATRSLACEIVYVDDGSRDGTLAIARDLPAVGLDVQVVVDLRRMLKQAGYGPDGAQAVTDESSRDHGDGQWGEPG